jgi:hypothetical protein
VTAPDSQLVFAQGCFPLPTLPLGPTWSGALVWARPAGDYRLILRVVRWLLRQAMRQPCYGPDPNNAGKYGRNGWATVPGGNVACNMPAEGYTQMLPASHPAMGTGLETRTSPAHHRRRTWAILALSGLMLIALGLRLHAAWQRNHEGPPDLALHLVGDEPGYEALAYALLQGSFFQNPGRVPVYPMFIAATYYTLGQRSPANLLYIQAFVGVLAVPLTYLLARRFTGLIPALVAAGIVAVDDALIYHARQIYSEVLYTPLFLATLLALLWALRVPRMGRFVWVGAGMGVATLCRPSTVLMPLILSLLLPRVWPLKQKAGASWSLRWRWRSFLSHGPTTTGGHIVTSSP